MMNPKITFISNIKSKSPSAFENRFLNVIIDEIAKGTHTTKVNKIRALERNGKSDEANKLKETLPAFLTSGIYSGGHSRDNMIDFSGLLILDFDHIPQTSFDEKFAIACSIATTLACFRSPRGNGFKTIIPISLGKEYYSCSYAQVSEFYEDKLGLKSDPSCKNINRLCFVSSDPNLYHNPGCEVFQNAPCPDVNEIEIVTQTESDLTKEEIQINFNKAELNTKRIITFKEGYRNNFVFYLAYNCYRLNIPINNAISLILLEYGYDQVKVKSTIASAYQNGKGRGKTVVLLKEHLFSIDLLNFKRYNHEIELEERILFEAFLIKMLSFNGEFYLTMKMIQQEMGIKRTRAQSIIRRFIDIGFISKRRITIQKENEPRQKNYYEVIPEKIIETSKMMFIDNTEFVKRISPLLVGFIDSRQNIQ